MFWERVSRTRGLLLVILAAILLLHGARHLVSESWPVKQMSASEPTDFTLQVWGTDDFLFVDDETPELPMFGPETGQWTLNGQPLADFVEVMRGLEVGPHGSNPFVVVNLPPNATVDHYRRAIASLVEQGICQVGVYEPGPAAEYIPANAANPDWPPQGYVSVYRVLSVEPDDLPAKGCEDRFPPWVSS